MITSVIQKYLLGGMAIAIFSLSLFSFYQKQHIELLKSQKDNLVKENKDLTLVNEENLKTIKSFQENIIFNEKLVFEQSEKLKELSNKTCSTIVKIKELSSSKNQKGEMNESCNVDSYIPSELDSLFTESGY